MGCVGGLGERGLGAAFLIVDGLCVVVPTTAKRGGGFLIDC